MRFVGNYDNKKYVDWQWDWSSILESSYDMSNVELMRICSDYINWEDDSSKEILLELNEKFDEIKKDGIDWDGELLEHTKNTNWDSFITYEQLLDIFPIEYLNYYDPSIVRNVTLRKILKDE